MSSQYSRLGGTLVGAALLFFVLLTGSTITTSVASACDFAGSEVAGGCGTITPPAPPAPPPPEPPEPPCDAQRGDPISLFSGREHLSVTDLVVNGTYPISMVRQYDSASLYDSSVGYGWAFNLDKRLYKYADNSVVIRVDCGVRNKYLFVGGAYQPQQKGVQPTLVEQSDGSFVLTESTGGKETYDAQGRLSQKQDAQGNRLEFVYDSRGRLPLTGSSPYSLTPATPAVVAYDYRLTKIVERLASGALTGNSVTLTYADTTGRLQKIAANDGRQVTYGQDQTVSAKNGNLLTVTGLAGINSIYDYTDSAYAHAVTKIQEGSANDTPYLNTYDAATGKVIKQTFGQDTFVFVYNPLQTVATHTIKNSAGTLLSSETSTYTFEGNGFPTGYEWVLSGGPKYKKVMTRNATTALVDVEVLSEWPIGASAYTVTSTINYKYDTTGNKIEEVVTLVTGEKITKSWTYDNGRMASEQVVSNLAPAKLFRTEYTFFYGPDAKPTNIKEKKRRLDDGSFQVTAYTYNADGRLLATTQPNGIVVQNVYAGDKLTQTYLVQAGTQLPFLQKTFGYDANGNLNSIKDAKDNITTLVYDDQRRVIKVTDALNEETYYRYTGKLLTEIEKGRTTAAGEGQITQRTYTAEGWLQTVKQKKDDSSFQTIASYTYNSAGAPLTFVSYRDGAALTTSYEHDALNRQTKVTDPVGNITKYAYDANGNRIVMIDAKSRETDYTYDALSRVTKVEQKGITPSATTLFSYDAVGNLLAVTDPESKITSYVYDALSQRTQVVQPLGQSVKYFYDNMNRVDYVVNARGQKTDYEYASWGAVDHVDYYPTESAGSYTKRIQNSYDYNGNIESITDSSIGSTPLYQLTYDALNRADVVTSGYLPITVTLDNDYDRYGNRSQFKLQDGVTAASSFSYNKLNQLSAVSLPGNQNIGLTYYTDAALMKQITLPSNIATAYQYSNAGMLQSITTTGSAGILDQLSYVYDPVQNINTLTSSRDGGVNAYSYDGLDHLTSATRPAGYGIADEAYSYDKAGNRELPNDASQYDYDNNNRMVKSPGLTYGYDGDGNQTSRSDGAVFTYDGDNHLVTYSNGSTSANYLYDPFGRRIKKVVSGVTTYYVWNGDQLLAEYDGAGTRQRRYASLPNSINPIQVQDANGIYAIHSDHLQMPRFLTDSTEKVVWSAKQSAFGTMQVNEDVDGNGVPVRFNLRFPGQYADSETGLYYNWHRYYDPGAGRYITSDPIGLRGGLNTYLYVGGNPLTRIDPSGQYWVLVEVGVWIIEQGAKRWVTHEIWKWITEPSPPPPPQPGFGGAGASSGCAGAECDTCRAAAEERYKACMDRGEERSCPTKAASDEKTTMCVLQYSSDLAQCNRLPSW